VEDLADCRIILFSYGSGLASSMYSLRVTKDHSPQSDFHKLVNNLSDVKMSLDRRKKVAPEIFDNLMKLRETTHHKGEYSIR
jgi:hydroxymethylglutaryl-CoA synthase